MRLPARCGAFRAGRRQTAKGIEKGFFLLRPAMSRFVRSGSTRVGRGLDQRGVDSAQQSHSFGCTAPPGRRPTCGDFNRERRFSS